MAIFLFSFLIFLCPQIHRDKIPIVMIMFFSLSFPLPLFPQAPPSILPPNPVIFPPPPHCSLFKIGQVSPADSITFKH